MDKKGVTLNVRGKEITLCMNRRAVTLHFGAQSERSNITRTQVNAVTLNFIVGGCGGSDGRPQHGHSMW